VSHDKNKFGGFEEGYSIQFDLDDSIHGWCFKVSFNGGATVFLRTSSDYCSTLSLFTSALIKSVITY
jgi:hypothetical protein